MGDTRAPHFSQQYKPTVLSSMLHFLEKPLEGHLHYKTKTNRNLLQPFQPHPLLLRLGWKTPNRGVILLVANYSRLKIKDLTSPKVISSVNIGGKERRGKKYLGLLWTCVKASWGGHQKACSSTAQLTLCWTKVGKGCRTGTQTPVGPSAATGHL